MPKPDRSKQRMRATIVGVAVPRSTRNSLNVFCSIRFAANLVDPEDVDLSLEAPGGAAEPRGEIAVPPTKQLNVLANPAGRTHTFPLALLNTPGSADGQP